MHRRCAFTDCTFQSEDLEEFARHTDGHAVQYQRLQGALEQARTELQTARQETEAARALFRSQTYWLGVVQGSGEHTWSESGKDLRGYEEWDLLDRVAVEAVEG